MSVEGGAPLRVEGVGVDIAGRRIIDDITLSALSNIVGVVGPNGSGKSTLLRTIYRMLRPAEGRVLADGRDVWTTGETDERVVEDGNPLTAAGVTAGMDLAIALVAKLCSDDYARFSLLGAEYAPQPPFDAGTPHTAGDELTRIAREFMAPMEEELRAIQSL